jgi:hypothetical protein
MARSTSRHSTRFQTEKPLAHPPVSMPQLVPSPVVQDENAGSGNARGPWIAMLIWFAAFLGLSLTIWFDYFYGLVRH